MRQSNRRAALLGIGLAAGLGVFPAQAENVVKSIPAGEFAYNASIPDQSMGHYELNVPISGGRAGFSMARPLDLTPSTPITVVLRLHGDPADGTFAEWRLEARSDKTGFGMVEEFESSSPIMVDNTYTQTFYIPSTFTRNTNVWLMEFVPEFGPAVQRVAAASVSYQRSDAVTERSIHVSAGGFLYDAIDPAVTLPNSVGLFWEHTPSASSDAGFYLSRPKDWDGASEVRVRIHFFLPQASAGVLRWRMRPMGYQPDGSDVILNGPKVLSDDPLAFPIGSPFRYFNQVFTLPASHPALQNPVWALHFLRGRDLDGEDYPFSILVLGAEVIYESDGPQLYTAITASAGQNSFLESYSDQQWANYWVSTKAAGRSSFEFRNPADRVPYTPIWANVLFATRTTTTVGAVRWRINGGLYLPEEPLLINAGTSVNTVFQQTVVMDGLPLDFHGWARFYVDRGTEAIGETVEDDLALLAMEFTYVSSVVLFEDGFEQMGD